MNEIEDKLSFRYHRSLQAPPDAYYRCPTSESLDGALRNEFQRSATSIIPVEVVTEFLFASTSTVTIPTCQQENLDLLGLIPAEVPQTITVDHALCHNFAGKARLKTQRAVARSFIDVIQGIDGFKYTERQACNKDGSEGTRFKYVCVDSYQNRERKSNQKDPETDDGSVDPKKGTRALPTFDCGGAIHIKFSTKQEAINILYTHNPIHRDVESRPTNGTNGVNGTDATLGTSSEDNGTTSQIVQPSIPRGAKNLKRKRPKANAQPEDDYDHGGLDMSTSPEAERPSPKKRRNKKTQVEPPQPSPNKKTKKKAAPPPKSPAKSRKSKKVREPEPAPPPSPQQPTNPIEACIRCKEKKIKCDRAAPTCNQCKRGLWTCHYKTKPDPKSKRSRGGCVNCRQRHRRCGEEKPSCAYCLKIDDDCQYTYLG